MTRSARTLPARLARLLTAAVTTVGVALSGALLTVPTAHAAPPEDYARYDGQSTCASEVLPGTEFLMRYLLRKYPGGHQSSLLRSCAGDSTSEHKDGRALDWAMDAADERDAATVRRFLDDLFASDGQGNAHALARRMGIMYIIWDDHSYASYRGFQKAEYLSSSCPTRKKCSKTLRHRDHVHISLSRAGAAAQTSFYRTRKVPNVPVLYPRTGRLDPESTAIVRFSVPATGRAVRSDFKLTRGVTYRVVADGRYRHGAGDRVSDAACTWSRDGWVESRSLVVNGSRPWTTPCDGRHTHVGYYTATSTDPLRVKIVDDSPGDNAGGLTFYLLREDLAARSVSSRFPVARPEPRPARRNGQPGRALVKDRLTVRAAAAKGVLTSRALRRKSTYRVVVTGVARSGDTVFDGRCVSYAGRLRPEHTLDLTDPAADHLSLYIQGVKVALRAPDGNRIGCDGRNHRYVGVFKPVVGGKARVKIWDPFERSDNSGELTVTLRRR